jgi:hypothetical protein
MVVQKLLGGAVVVLADGADVARRSYSCLGDVTTITRRSLLVIPDSTDGAQSRSACWR